MTLIAVAKDENEIVMGCDSAFGYGYERGTLKDNKIVQFLGGTMLVGLAGCMRQENVLSMFTGNFYLDDLAIEANSARDTVFLFVDQFRTFAKEKGIVTVGENGEGFDGEMTVAYKGELFMVGGDFGVATMTSSYDAIGSGRSVALGAMYAVGISCPPEKRIRMGFDAAAAWMKGSVGGAWRVERVPMPTP